ncbi:MAG: DinB family protein [Promethearchaeota archaeon]
MTEIEFIKSALRQARKWRERIMTELVEVGCIDLSFRPSNGMSSLGWLLAHQAAVLDFSLNVIIKKKTIKNTRMFEHYRPGTSGEYDGVSLEAIRQYYDSGERDLLDWVENVDSGEMMRVIQEGEAPTFFVGMTIYEVLAAMFTHLNFHTGHLSAFMRDWKHHNHQ